MASDRTIRYAGSDGLHIAWQEFGSGPLDLVLVHGWVTNLEVLWEHPRAAGALERLGSFARVIQFDKRGTGLSDRVAPGDLPTLEHQLDADDQALVRSVWAQRIGERAATVDVDAAKHATGLPYLTVDDTGEVVKVYADGSTD